MGNATKLVYLLFCEGVNVTRDQNGNDKLIFLEPWMNYVVPFLPTQLTFTIIGGIDKLDPNTANEFMMILYDPNNDELYTQKGKFDLPEKPDNPSAPPTMTFMIDLKNIQIKVAGNYTAVIFLDGEKLGEQTLPIYEKVK